MHIETYQIRHKRLGYYQGTVKGNALWYPCHNIPKYGFIKFLDRKYAKDEIKMLIDKCQHDKEDIIIEPYQDEIAEGIRLYANRHIPRC